MRALTLVHRWLGVACAPLFAMWFASGIVMHFVPFPALTEAERLAGLGPIEFARVRHGPGDAVAASRLPAVTRVRLLQRSDGPVFIVSGSAGLAALHADDLTPADVHLDSLALGIAVAHARDRRLDASAATSARSAAYDQWTVAGGLSLHRPLYRVTLNDPAGTELYVSSVTGEVVRDTTRRERWWNYAGSVAHWIYPASLRARPQAWTAIAWVLSAVASLAAIAGAALGTALLVARRGLAGSAGSWHAWHHALGLVCAAFVLTWIVSGWLSLDSGLLFSTGALTEPEARALAPAPDWRALPTDPPIRTSGAKEVEWFFFGATPYRRDRIDLDAQLLLVARSDSATPPPRSFLALAEIEAVGRRLSATCGAAAIDVATDAYASASAVPGAPVFRIACGNLWFHVDAASGAIIDRLDPSRRARRWLFGAAHTFDFPWLAARPDLRGALVVVACGCGLAFSLTGCVIAWRRMRLWIGDAGSAR
jgi:uncharacterized iron-regulated membrane protein